MADGAIMPQREGPPPEQTRGQAEGPSPDTEVPPSPSNDGVTAATAASHNPTIRRRRWVRRILLPLGPLLIVAVALYAYLTGGRYVSTNDAFVRADMIDVSTDVAGLVAAVAVRENQQVAAGDLLVKLDNEPFRIALAAAEAKLAAVGDEITALKASYEAQQAQIEQAAADIVYYRDEFRRQQDLASRRVASEAKLSEARHNLDVALQRKVGQEAEAAATRARLGGDPARPMEEQAAYREALAAVERARRDLRHTRILAPRPGIVTKVNALHVGEYLTASQAAFMLVATDQVWIEANPKETQLTWVAPGNPAMVTVDTYPGRVWQAEVASVSPATGAEFAILPPQNASGNWVKVVQRIPVRLTITQPPDAPPLRAGMSVEVRIDTGHSNSLGDLMAMVRRWVGG